MWDIREFLARYKKPNPQLRMFWACTHRTLRATELPILEQAGFRVVAEQLNYEVLNYIDSADYLDFKSKRVPGMSRQHQLYAERSRLYQRLGQLENQEKKFFNEHFDVIYCPTSLTIACSVAAWFRGTVVYRHFGSHFNLQSLNAQIDNCAPELVSQIIYCPIFDSLAKLPEAARFLAVKTLHASSSFDDINRSWDFDKSEKRISLTINEIGTSDSSREELRPFLGSRLSPRIKVYGKNDVSCVSNDVKQKLAIAGLLPRAEYLQQWLRSRLFVYWRQNPFHMHYTPLEAIAAGMPVLFSYDTPLAKENEYRGMSAQRLNELGACENFQELETRADQLFNNRQALESLSERQAELLAPFSRHSLEREAQELRTSCAPTCGGSQVRSPLSSDMKIIANASAKCVINAYTELKTAVPLSAFTIPLAPFAVASGHRVANHRGKSGISVDAESPRTNVLVLGRIDEPLNLMGQIRLRIQGVAFGEGEVVAAYEFWSLDGTHGRNQCSFEQERGQIEFNECLLSFENPVAILGVAFTFEGSGSLCIQTLDVRVDGGSEGVSAKAA